MNETVKKERAMRGRLYELAETQRWVHHVADLDSGEVVTSPLDRPVMPLSRAERLSQLGHRFSPAVFGWPFQWLTPREVYQPSPLAWLVANSPTSFNSQTEYPAGHGAISWDYTLEPDDWPSWSVGMYFVFHSSPAGRCVASISLMGYTFKSIQASIDFGIWAGPEEKLVSVPINSSFGSHTVDLTFVPDPPGSAVGITMALPKGIQHMTWTGTSLAAEPPWIDPEPPI